MYKKDAKPLIDKIWGKFSKTKPPYAEIINAANSSYKKDKGKKFKIGTYISWWTRFFAKDN